MKMLPEVVSLITGLLNKWIHAVARLCADLPAGRTQPKCSLFVLVVWFVLYLAFGQRIFPQGTIKFILSSLSDFTVYPLFTPPMRQCLVTGSSRVR